MRTKLTGFIVALCLAGAPPLSGDVVRAPLMGHIVPMSQASVSWFSETRIWNPNMAPAMVTITDVVGLGNPLIREFTVPAQGMLDLRNFELFFTTDPPPEFYPSFLALVEFTSDRPIVVLTQISALEPESAGPGIQCVYLPYFGGHCFRPVAGPQIRGFHDYVMPGSAATLAWLTAGVGYRDNLFITNPSSATLTTTATFRTAGGEAVAAKTYTVGPRSILIVGDALRDGAIKDAVGDGAITATFAGDGPFYVFAAVVSESPACNQQPLYALVQPEVPLQ
jgi:hypothetical protein